MEKRYLSVLELQNYIGLSKETIYRYSRCGQMPCFKIGKILRFDRLEIDKWIGKFKREDTNAGLLQTG